ncbi:DMT family transporter [Idiomarina sp. HP20-50]|uniref:DMT family transporter n=1 Tax=Idiomarina sp. HP20-50 TaxID=3070813 RepID=UPI0039822023
MRMNYQNTIVGLLYLFTVFSWGSAWVAIDVQLDYVSTQLSLFLRFIIAAVIMVFCYQLLKPDERKLTGLDHLFVIALGATNFSLNYLLVYEGIQYLGGSLSSVIFTTLVIWNILNARIFYKVKITMSVIFGCILGIGGVAIALQSPLPSSITIPTLIKGSLLVICAAYIVSIGNMIALRNSKKGISVLTANTYGMCWGALIITATIFLESEQDLVIPYNFSFTTSTLYLSLVCTVLGFFSYYLLIDKIAPSLFSYIIALFPVVSVGLDTVVFNKDLSEQIIWGIVIIFTGLFILLPRSISSNRRKTG